MSETPERKVAIPAGYQFAITSETDWPMEADEDTQTCVQIAIVSTRRRLLRSSITTSHAIEHFYINFDTSAEELRELVHSHKLSARERLTVAL